VAVGAGGAVGEAIAEAATADEADWLGMVAIEPAGCGDVEAGGPEQAITSPTTTIAAAMCMRPRAARRAT